MLLLCAIYRGWMQQSAIVNITPIPMSQPVSKSVSLTGQITIEIGCGNGEDSPPDERKRNSESLVLGVVTTIVSTTSRPEKLSQTISNEETADRSCRRVGGEAFHDSDDGGHDTTHLLLPCQLSCPDWIGDSAVLIEPRSCVPVYSLRPR